MSESRLAPPTPAAQGFWPSAALASAALLLVLCLRQRALHGEDTRLFVMWLGAGDLGALPRHFAFLPLVSGLGSLLRPLGLRWFDVMLVASAIGSAAGVFALHRAGRRLCPPGMAAWWLPVALLVVPAWLFFATAAEIHGVFLGPLSAPFYQPAGDLGMIARPGPLQDSPIGHLVQNGVLEGIFLASGKGGTLPGEDHLLAPQPGQGLGETIGQPVCLPFDKPFNKLRRASGCSFDTPSALSMIFHSIPSSPERSERTYRGVLC